MVYWTDLMLKLIFLIIVGVLALSFFGISLEAIVNSPAGQSNFAYLSHLLTIGWKALVLFIQSLFPHHP
ncbi:hypothetical protein HY091_00895 [Candidatus Kaiserbacteria bacterium]|nr:hypothetical protein [Candidatus Kaiserbacteria bacterium]